MLPPGATASIGTIERPLHNQGRPGKRTGTACRLRGGRSGRPRMKPSARRAAPAGPSVSAAGGSPPGTKKPVIRPIRGAGEAGERRESLPQPALGGLKYGVHAPADVLMKQGLDPVDPCSHLCHMGKRRAGRGYAHVSAGWLALLRMNTIDVMASNGTTAPPATHSSGQ